MHTNLSFPIKRTLLYCFYFILHHLRLFHIFHWKNRTKTLVLTYHNIIPDHLFDHSVHLGMSHRESVFERHVRFIKYHLKNRKVIFTFDDGYQNQFKIASKILECHALTGIFFVTFKLLCEQKTLIIDKILQWVSYAPCGHYLILNQEISINDNNRFNITSHFYEKLLSHPALWDKIEDELNCAYPFNSLTIQPELQTLRFSPMQPEEITTLIKNGHTVAAHGYDHLPLATLPIEQQKEDFLKCKSYAEKYCNSPLYSYPYGGTQEVSPETIALCQAAGFESAYTNVHSILWPEKASHYQLPRMSLPNDGRFYVLNAKLSGFEDFCKSIIKKFIVLKRAYP